MVEVLARLSGNSAGMVGAFMEGQAAAEKFGATYDAVGKKVEASGATMMSTMSKVALVGAAVAGAVALVAVDMAAHFQKSTELLQTAGGMTADNLAKARDGILQISQSTGVAADDLSKGMYIVSKVTKDAGDGLLILKAAAQGAVAEGVDMGTMTTALTSIMTTYNLKAQDAVSTENALVAAAGASKTTMGEFAGSLSTVLPIAQSAGLSFDQISGAIATMTQHGTSADEATQELRNGIQNLLAPNSVAISMMNQMGVSSIDVSQNLGKRGLTGTLDLLRGAVLQHIDGGQVLLSTMKQSTTAAGDMGKMLSTMSGPLKSNSQALMDGSMTVKDYTSFLKGLDAAGNSQGHQFETLVKKSQGFNDAIKQGGPAALTYQQAMEKMMGGTTGLQTALMLTGDNMPGFVGRVAEIGGAMSKTGADISTNADTQATLAAQLARTKAMFEAMMITLGTGLIPVFADFLTGVKNVVDFLSQHGEDVSRIGTVLGIMAGAMIVVTAATWAWNAALDANPVVLIILGLGLLIAGLVLAYDHIGWFKDGVNAAWKWIQEAFSNSINWIVKTLIPDLIDAWAYLVKSFQDTVGMFKDFFTNTVGMFSDFQKNTSGMVKDWENSTGGMFKDFFTNTVGMFKDFFKNTVGMITDFGGKLLDGFKGWWKDPIGETGKFISTMILMLAKWEGDIIVGFLKWKDDVFKTVGDWVLGIYKKIDDFNKQTNGMFSDFFKNTLGMFTDFFTKTGPQSIDTFNKNTNGMFMDFFKNTLGMFGDFFKNTGGMVIDWAKNTKGMFDDFGKNTAGMFTDFFKNTVGMFVDFFHNTVGMVVDFIHNTIGMFTDWHNQLTGTTRTFVDGLIGFFQGLWRAISSVWGDIMKDGQYAFSWIGHNVFDPLKQAVGWVGDAFSNVSSTIRTVWSDIKSAAADPARFVVNTVYNSGIRPAWNAIAGAVGLGNLSLPSVSANFATGGVMPGYSPGIDNQLIAVSGGEAIMRPEWTRMVGVDNVHRMNAMAMGGDAAGISAALGLQHFASGGVANYRTGGGSGGSSLGDIAAGVVSNVGKFLADPLGGVKDLLNGAISGMSAGGGSFGQMMMAIPGMFIGKFADLVSGKEQAQQAAAAASAGPGTPGPGGGAGGAEQWSGLVLQALNMMGQPAFLLGTTLRRMNQESGGNPNAINNWDSNAAAGIPSKGLMQVIGPTFAANAMPGYDSNIYDPLSNILASMHYAIGRYGSLAAAYNQAGGYAMGGVIPTFDRGGTLAPGINVVNNATGAPETLGNTTGMEGATFELTIPELGGRMKAYVTRVVQAEHSEVSRALRNSAGVPQGGF
jgi:hypothetical protein